MRKINYLVIALVLISLSSLVAAQENFVFRYVEKTADSTLVRVGIIIPEKSILLKEAFSSEECNVLSYEVYPQIDLIVYNETNHIFVLANNSETLQVDLYYSLPAGCDVSGGIYFTLDSMGNLDKLPWCDGADLNKDGQVDSTDLAVFQSKTGSNDCSEENSWCENVDIDKNKAVDATDLSIIRENFGRTECGEEIIASSESASGESASFSSESSSGGSSGGGGGGSAGSSGSSSGSSGGVSSGSGDVLSSQITEATSPAQFDSMTSNAKAQIERIERGVIGFSLNGYGSLLFVLILVIGGVIVSVIFIRRIRKKKETQKD